MTQDRNQQNIGSGRSGQQQQQQGGMGGQQDLGGQQGAGRQQGSGQQQQFSTQQGQTPQGTDVNQQMGGRQAGGIDSPQQQRGMGGQSQNFAQQIRPHMEVVDNKGQHIGTVDSCEGNRIKLTKSDSNSGQHRYLDTNQIQSVDGGQIRLSGGAQFLS